MRFELGLRYVPNITVEQAKVKLATLPKGVSTGLIIKGIQEGYVPTAFIAWSEDKRVLNEIEDRLNELGFECYVVDHGFFVARWLTLFSEKLGRARYREKEKSQGYISLGEGKRKAGKSVQSVLAQHLMMLAVQLVIVEGLFVWRMGINLGVVNLASAKNLAPPFLTCALGLFAAYVATTAIQAYRTGQLSKAGAAPFVLLPLCVTLGALFYLKIEQDVARQARAIGRPPSSPFAGLLVELRKRGAGDAELAAGADGANRRGFGAEGEEDDGIDCIDPSAWGWVPECIAGPDWDMTRACLPMPKPPRRPKVVEQPIAKKVARVAIARPAKRKVVMRPWAVRFEALDLVELLAAWLISMGAVAFLGIVRRKAALQGAPEPAQPAQGAPAVESGVQNEEVQQLRAELAQARAQLARPQAAGEDTLVLQQQLEETQASLLTHQGVIANFKQQLGPIKQMHAEQLVEIERLRSMLAQAQAATQQAATPHVARPVAQRAQAPANTQGGPRRAAIEVSADDETERARRRRT